jgi:hypothetical protein
VDLPLRQSDSSIHPARPRTPAFLHASDIFGQARSYTWPILYPSRPSEGKGTHAFSSRRLLCAQDVASWELALFASRRRMTIPMDRLTAGMLIVKIMLIELTPTLMGIMIYGPYSSHASIQWLVL